MEVNDSLRHMFLFFKKKKYVNHLVQNLLKHFFFGQSLSPPRNLSKYNETTVDFQVYLVYGGQKTASH